MLIVDGVARRFRPRFAYTRHLWRSTMSFINIGQRPGKIDVAMMTFSGASWREATHMARFFFNFRSGDEFLEDPEGQVVVDLAAARLRGIEALREILAGDVITGILDMSFSIEIEDENHAAVTSVAFDEALTLWT